MSAYSIPAMSTETAAKWAEVLDPNALRQIADWCGAASESLRAEAHWLEGAARGAIIADCARFEATAGHLRGLILTIEGN